MKNKLVWLWGGLLVANVLLIFTGSNIKTIGIYIGLEIICSGLGYLCGKDEYMMK